MLDYYVRYNIVTVIPLLESVYLYNKLPSELNLSKKLISLNYISKSPFYNSLIFSYKKNKNLFIWFSPPKNYNSLFVIPEGFIVYFFLSEMGDGLYKVSISHDTQLIVYVQNGILLLEFILSDISQLERIQYQYNQQVQNISYTQYKDLSNNVWKNPKFLLELRSFINFNISKSNIFSFFEKHLYYPIILVIMLYISISSYQVYQMQNTIENLTATYQSLKMQNSKVKDSIRKHNREVEKYETFMKKELYYQDPIKILASLDKVIHKNEDAKIDFLSISPLYMKINITTKENAIKYFRRLNKLGYFKDVTIESTYKNKNGEKTYSYSLVLKVLS